MNKKDKNFMIRTLLIIFTISYIINFSIKQNGMNKINTQEKRDQIKIECLKKYSK